MALEDVPIQFFVTQQYLTPAVQKIVDGWRVEPQQVIDRLVDHYREMGLFRVHASQEKMLAMDIVHQLRNSPELTRLVQRARSHEASNARARAMTE
jgi:hypothetical protein